ncbi:RNA 2',3'-cyclic phosphodiesterase [Enterobacteriaceae bacterium YMB-R22]|uniref:RNA 2',3'-cyclic phosphodiesterase n=1 Tax=Tenebrionicola larvae TaxID=2815733 RepID=UPI0020115713|nr:RNA 2',3'-cyclic phosphodiesterase [Tenebrionicola larvae]MBV4412554.1 RNA 2',3'-cyclic phosphodiesterase [Tenebrionicola larvae]
MSTTRRLFFALEIPDELQQQIVYWRAQCFPAHAGRPVAAANLHMTLAFLGEIGAQKQQALCTLAGRIRQPGFTLTLNDAGHWPRPRVVWLGPRRTPRGLLQLASILRSQAARSGCAQNPQPFHPHVTLYRQASDSVSLPPPGFAWQWPVNAFALYASVFERGRTHYRLLSRWPLDNAP